MSSIALRAPARHRSTIRRLQAITLRQRWLRVGFAFADPEAAPAAKREALGRFTAAAVAVSLFAGSLMGTTSVVTEPTAATGSGNRGPTSAGIPPLGERVGDAGSGAEVGALPPETEAKLAKAAPARKLPLPSGKGMWLWQPEAVEGADPHAIVAKARAHNLTHLFVRTGSSWQGFHGAEFLNSLLPVAHEAGLRIYGWDFPNLADPAADVARSVTAIRHTAPGGHRIDGFVPDIETWSEGTRLTREGIQGYGEGLRAAVGPDYPLVVAVPRPSAQKLREFDYGLVLEPYDAVAPMVYWLNRQPDTDIHSTMSELARFGKPVLPIGQAYDGAPEGGRPGPPPADEIQRFMRTAEQHGAVSVSFWSWQHADTDVWSAIRDAPEFRLRPAHPAEMRPGEVKAMHHLLRGLGYSIPLSSKWSDKTAEALRAFQKDAGLEETGRFNRATRRVMLQSAHPGATKAAEKPAEPTPAQPKPKDEQGKPKAEKAKAALDKAKAKGRKPAPTAETARSGKRSRPTVVRLPNG